MISGLPIKRILSAITMTNISQTLYLHDGGKNQIDMEQNYVTISP